MITAGGIGLVAPTDSGTVHRPQTLEDYVAAAQRYSPLIKEQHLQTAANAAELERLRAVYLRSRLELNGDFLFVPIVETTGGRTSFKWNAQSATDYYGYDLGESSGHFHAGATWTQPLLGRQAYAAAKWQTQVDADIAANRIRIERHELRRAVTEQYLLCLLDNTQKAFADSIVALLAHQSDVVKRLAVAGLATTSDLRLLDAERTAAEEQVTTQRTNYHTHLMELRLLCGITDTTATELAATDITLSAAPSSGSGFTRQYRLDSLRAEADLRTFDVQYRPQLNLYVDGGAQFSQFSNAYRHFGWSAGLTFKWTLFDGHQRRQRLRQTRLRQEALEGYRLQADQQRHTRLHECATQLRAATERNASLKRQLDSYDTVLANYERELQLGQRSVIDYINVLRLRIQTQRDRLLLAGNRQLLLAAYNYWNW